MKAGEQMGRKKKLINRTPYPDYVIETVARCLWPDIQAFFESEEGQREFEEWKAQQEHKNSQDILKLQLRNKDATNLGGICFFANYNMLHTTKKFVSLYCNSENDML